MNPEKSKIISNIRLFLLDMDGTVYLGESWLEGAREFLGAVTASGREYAFLTNNASRGLSEYVAKLKRMGMDVPEKRFISSANVTVEYILKNYPQKSVFVLGTEALKNEFRKNGIDVCEDGGNVAVVSFDTELNYKKMCIICDLVRSGAPYIATHPDYNCPVEGGDIPDAGANIAFIKASTGRFPDAVMGKPEPEIIEYALRRFCVDRSHAAMVGDRLYTDIAAGNNAGICSILVLSGETSSGMLRTSEIRPTETFDSVGEIIEYL